MCLRPMRLVDPVGPDGLAELLGVGCDAALTASRLERGLQTAYGAVERPW
ncbi:hypothetical protein ACFV8E_41160 [Streptomyces sp. NPDC059849]